MPDKAESRADLRPARIRDLLGAIEGVLIDNLPEYLRSESPDRPGGQRERAIAKGHSVSAKTMPTDFVANLLQTPFHS